MTDRADEGQLFTFTQEDTGKTFNAKGATKEAALERAYDKGFTKYGSYRSLEERVSHRSDERPELMTGEDGLVPGFVWETLDTVDAPRSYALHYGNALLQTGDPGFAHEVASAGSRRNDHPVSGDIFMQMLEERRANPPAERELTGEYDRDSDRMFNELLARPEIMGGISAVGGTLADIVIDPVTWAAAPIKAAGMVGKAAKTGLSRLAGWADDALTKIAPDAMGKVHVAGQTAADVGTKVKGLWDTSADLKEHKGFQKLYSHMNDRLYAKSNKIVQGAKNRKAAVADMAKELDVDPEGLERFIVQAVDSGKTPDDLLGVEPKALAAMIDSPSVANEIKQLSTKNRLQYNAERRMGARTGGNAVKAQKQYDDYQKAMHAQLARVGNDPSKIAGIVDPVDGKTLLTGKEAVQKMRSLRDAVDTVDRQNYLAHMVTDEFRQHMKLQKAKKGVKKFAGRPANPVQGKHGSQIQRKYEGTIEELNLQARNGDLPGYPGFKGKAFRDDPATVQAIRDLRHDEVRAAAGLIQDAVDKGFGVRIGDMMAEAGYKRTAVQQKRGAQNVFKKDDVRKVLEETGRGDWVQPRSPVARGTYVPPEVAARLDGVYDLVNNPQETGAFLQAWDGMHKVFKDYTLFPFPVYHTRNALSNMFNNWVVGVKNPNRYAEAGQLQIAMRGNTKALAKPSPVEGMTYGDLLDEIDEFAPGQRRGGFTEEMAELNAVKEIETGGKQTVGEWLLPHRQGFVGKKFGQAIEQNARLANYIDGRVKGMSPEDASARATKALFDYADLTKAEQKVMKRVMPFYTWSRKNIPFHLEQLVQNPGKYKAFDSVRRNVEATMAGHGMNEDERYLPQYLLDKYPMRWSVDPKTGEASYLLMGGLVPMADLMNLSSPTDFIVSQLSPAMKLMWETTTGLTADKRMREFDPDMETDFLLDAGSLMKGQVKRGRVSEQTRSALRNIRFLTLADDIVNATMPETMSRKYKGVDNRVDNLTDFMLKNVAFGLKATKVSLAQQKMNLAKAMEWEERDTMADVQRQIIRSQAADPLTQRREIQRRTQEGKRKIMEAYNYMVN